MPKAANNNHLLVERHLTVVLRLVLDRRGAIDHGELVGMNGALVGHFRGRPGMNRILQEWIKSERRKDE